MLVWYLGGAQGDQFLSYKWLAPSPTPGWLVVAVADFNADGHPDLVWQNTNTRQVVVWFLSGPDGSDFLGWDWISSESVPGWRVVAIADFNSDGSPDLLWQNDTTGQVVVWYMGGTQGRIGWSWISEGGVFPWRVVGVGDFNGDYHPDLILQNDVSRQVMLWYMGGAQGNVFLGWNWISSDGVAGWRVR